jgi:hypothetical protein
MIARASPTRFFMPPERSDGARPSTPSSPTIPSASRTFTRMTRGSSFVCSSSGSATFSPTVIQLISAPLWKR